VKVAHAPMLALFTELMEKVDAEGSLREGLNPKRMAAMTMQTVMFIAQSSGGDDSTTRPITADEVWNFCSQGFAAR
jgi:predicted pyridoxine 5'-phosphate oxidase superfamily flavin-nucleotide-binding protein